MPSLHLLFNSDPKTSKNTLCGKTKYHICSSIDSNTFDDCGINEAFENNTFRPLNATGIMRSELMLFQMAIVHLICKMIFHNRTLWCTNRIIAYIHTSIKCWCAMSVSKDMAETQQLILVVNFWCCFHNILQMEVGRITLCAVPLNHDPHLWVLHIPVLWT